jgi:hypothetical protein
MMCEKIYPKKRENVFAKAGKKWEKSGKSPGKISLNNNIFNNYNYMNK